MGSKRSGVGITMRSGRDAKLTKEGKSRPEDTPDSPRRRYKARLLTAPPNRSNAVFMRLPAIINLYSPAKLTNKNKRTCVQMLM